MSAFKYLTREQLHEHATTYFKTGGQTEPEVALVEYQGQLAILKDYGRTPGWFGRIIAPILIAREVSTLKRLDELAGFPKLYRKLDRQALVMQYLPAKPWGDIEPKPSRQCYQKLAALITKMHEHGVAHGDLRSLDNILLDEQGQPQLVDFVARVHRGAQWNIPWNWIFKRFCKVDNSAIIKLKLRYAPDLITIKERATIDEGVFSRLARKLGQGVRRVVRFFVRQT